MEVILSYVFLPALVVGSIVVIQYRQNIATKFKKLFTQKTPNPD